jgi:hypothetical protein
LWAFLVIAKYTRNRAEIESDRARESRPSAGGHQLRGFCILLATCGAGEATADGNGKCPSDLKRQATGHWRRFLVCMKGFATGQAEALWQTVLAEMAGQQPATADAARVTSDFAEAHADQPPAPNS